MTCHFGDCRDSMRRLIAEGVRVQMCVTSPPYWGLRDYGHAGQLGLESTPAEYVANMVGVFGLVREMLADDGVLWLNLGDSYSGSGPSGASYQSTTTKARAGQKRDGSFVISDTLTARGLTYAEKKPIPAAGLKAKDLIGIPWRVAFALQADGWYLRQDIIWAKPNPMPESVTDRCTKSHEYIFMLTKSAKYYYDAAAIAEPLTCTRKRGSGPMVNPGTGRNDAGTGTVGDYRDKQSGHGRRHAGFNARYFGSDQPYTGKATKDYATAGAQDASATKARIVDRILSGEITTRNKRDVWTIPTSPYPDAHFATFPPDLIEPCILAGSRAGDTVLDPFLGSGTVGEVCNNLGRQWLGCELNEAYRPLQERRTAQQGMVFA